MEMKITNDSVSCQVTESSQIGEARRKAVALAERIGFGETETGKVALVVTELAGNLVKHAREGELLFQVLERNSTAGVEVISIDKGPGMDLARCRPDGYSTAGTPGTGLGAIMRSSTKFDFYSSVAGTVLLCHFWPANVIPKEQTSAFEVGAINQPFVGEPVSGDAWGHEDVAGRSLFLVADGLGHGLLAADASREALRIFHDHVGRESGEILHAIHAALRATRGAAVAVAVVHYEENTLCFAGVGNIAGTIITGTGSRSMVSHNGIVGHQLHKVQEFVYAFPAGAILVMHSDGLTTNWKLDPYPGLLSQAPIVIAAVLYRDFKRGRDDVSVVVARARTSQEASA
jgi:anti-sigma regulatory factor (Ser/Thr protein kinase)